MLPLVAQDTNTITITVTTTIKLVQTGTEIYTVSTNVSTTSVTNDLTHPQQLLQDIRKLENHIFELTNGIPMVYVAVSSSTSTNMIQILDGIWKEYNHSISNLTVKRKEFQKSK